MMYKFCSSVYFPFTKVRWRLSKYIFDENIISKKRFFYIYQNKN